MKETYLSRDFRETAAQCFPAQAKQLNAFFDARLNVLLAENADASKEKQYHLKRQIFPGIAVTRPVQKFIIVRDDKQNITVLCQLLQPFGHLAHMAEIQSACRLVKNQKFLFAHNCLTDGKPLPLSARQGKRIPVDVVKQVKAIQQILNLLIGGIRIGRQALVFHTVRKLRKVRDDTDESY